MFTVQQLIDHLNQFDKSMPVKILLNCHDFKTPPQEFQTENILLTSETAHVNPDAPEDEWDCEDGRIHLGYGQQYILINPIIV